MYDDEMMDAMTLEMCDYDNEAEMQELAEFLRGDLDFEDAPVPGFYEDWDNLELGFDPYLGCYTDDC